MFKTLRRTIKALPVIGPALHRLYLTVVYAEGRVEEIRSGPLRGLKFRRFMHTFNPKYVAGTYEPDIQSLFVNHIRPGQVVYDVGANVGFMTLLAARLVGESGTVVSFEPGIETARQLRSQIEINGLRHVVVYDVAIADKVGTASFVVDTYSVMARLGVVEMDGPPPLTRQVETTTLDSVLDYQRPPDFVKLDVEGAEILALSGAARLLDVVRPILAVELHSAELGRAFHALMAAKDYRVTRIDGKEADPTLYERFVLARPTEKATA